MSGALGKAGLLSRCTAAHARICESGAQKMIDPTAKRSVSRQAIMLGISRGSVCYMPRPVSDAGLKLMHRIRCPAGYCAALPERGQAAYGLLVRGQPDAAGTAGSGRVQGRALAHCHADETHGN